MKSTEKTDLTAEASAAGLDSGLSADPGKRREVAKNVSGVGFEQRLQALLGSQDAVTAARMRIIDTSKIRQRYAEVWDEVGPDVHTGIQQLIEQHLGNRDFVTSIGDYHVVAFPDYTEEQARRECASVLKVVMTWLMGQKISADDTNCETTVIRIDGELNPKIFNLDSLTLAFEEAGRSSETGPSFLDNVSIAYRPLLNSRLKTVSSYRCLPAREKLGGEILVGEGLISKDTDAVDVALLDGHILHNAADNLRIFAEQGGTPLFLTVPLHFSTIADTGLRDGFAELLTAVPRALRRFLVVEVVGLPRDVKEDVFLNAVHFMKRDPVVVTARCPLRRRDFSFFRAAGVVSVGVHMDEFDEPEERALEKFDEFTERANEQKLKTYVYGLSSLSLAMAAVCAGFDHVAGDSVMPRVATPSRAHSFDIEEIYTTLLLSDAVKKAAQAS